MQLSTANQQKINFFRYDYDLVMLCEISVIGMRLLLMFLLIKPIFITQKKTGNRCTISCVFLCLFEFLATFFAKVSSGYLLKKRFVTASWW